METSVQKYILSENVLSDNLLILPSKGFIFKGGIIAIVQEFTVASAWVDRMTEKRFRSKTALFKYLDKHYPDFGNTCDLSDTILYN